VRAGTLWCQWLTHPSERRVAYAIGRSVGSAVARNRLRRRLRAIVAAHEAALPPGWYLIGATPAAANLSFAALQQTTLELLRRVAPSSPATDRPSPPGRPA
jgi:ribonuclease P protein component